MVLNDKGICGINMSKLVLDKETVLWCIEHILKHGDTDIFPHPFEMQFLEDKKDQISTSLSEINLHAYRPISLIESLVPKSRYSFRIAHQIHPVESILYTAAMVTIGNDIESRRVPANQGMVYSYRFDPNDDFDLFSKNFRYKDWLGYQFSKLLFAEEYTHIERTDISDFYQRIYHHRIENCLNEDTKDSPFSKFIFGCLKDWRIRQSFGLPVGGNASRIIAEAVLCDTDQSLHDEGYDFTRFVDDIVIFVKKGQDPYAALAFLAEHLATSEGLSLAAHKTKIYSPDDYILILEESRSTQPEGDTLKDKDIETLFWSAYDEDEINESFEELKARDLAGALKTEIAKDYWDVSKIRLLLRALKLTKNQEASKFIRSNLQTLLPFVKDIAPLIDELKKDGDQTFHDMTEEVIDLILHSSTRPLPAIRSWLFELFTKNILPISNADLRKFMSLTHLLDTQQIYLLKNIKKDLNFFRRLKSRIDELSSWQQPVFIYSANCLPKDEYETWVNNIKGRLSFPLSDIFCQWCIEKKRESDRPVLSVASG